MLIVFNRLCVLLEMQYKLTDIGMCFLRLFFNYVLICVLLEMQYKLTDIGMCVLRLFFNYLLHIFWVPDFQIHFKFSMVVYSFYLSENESVYWAQKGRNYKKALELWYISVTWQHPMNANLYSRYSLHEHTNWPFLGHSTSGALLNNLLSYINRSYVHFTSLATRHLRQVRINAAWITLLKWKSLS